MIDSPIIKKNTMKSNVGKTDKVIRILLGIIIAALGVYFKSWWGLVALIPLVTAFAGFCPLWGIFGINTHSKKVEVK
jgi:predicted RND superfamily exporter protein